MLQVPSIAGKDFYDILNILFPLSRMEIHPNITKNMTDGSTRNNTYNGTGILDDAAVWKKILPLIVIGAIIVIENALVCLAFATNPKLRKKQSNILVCSQAAIDFLVGGVFIPWAELEAYKKERLYSEYMIYYVLMVSLGNLLSLAADRYLAIIKPLKHHMQMSIGRTKRILLVIWVTPLFLTMIPLSWDNASPDAKALAVTIYLSISWVVIFFTCITMISMYIRIYITSARTIRLRQERIESHRFQTENRERTTRKELRVAHLFGLLLLFFILAYLPFLYMNLVHLLRDVIEDYEKYLPASGGDLIMYPLAINSLVNPILCVLLKKDYQLIIKRWICLEWMLDQRGDECQRSHTSRTKVSESEFHENGSEARRRSKLLQLHSYRNPEGKVHFSCKDETIALMKDGPRHTNGCECEINKNILHQLHDNNASPTSSPTVDPTQ